MNRSQALKEAVRLWGKKAAVRDSGKPTSEEARKTASAKLPDARAMYKSAAPAERKAYRAELDSILSVALAYRYSVGYVGSAAGLFSYFSVQGQGDTWEEAFAKATKRTSIAA
jgi:hypothetical protein